jgi:hypothetical protein
MHIDICSGIDCSARNKDIDARNKYNYYVMCNVRSMKYVLPVPVMRTLYSALYLTDYTILRQLIYLREYILAPYYICTSLQCCVVMFTL